MLQLPVSVPHKIKSNLTSFPLTESSAPQTLFSGSPPGLTVARNPRTGVRSQFHRHWNPSICTKALLL